MKWFSGKWHLWLGVVHRHPVRALSAIFVAGILFWGGFNWSLELTNTESFCTSCHAMKAYIYPEYKKSTHFANRTGVRASCPDCHVPRDWVHKVMRKVRATNELFHWLRGSIDKRADFMAKRLELAGHVWATMKTTDSRECRNCHSDVSMAPDSQGAKARIMHLRADDWGKTCIDCHKGITHTLPQGFDKDAIMDQLHERMEKEEMACVLCHEGMAKPPRGEDW